MTGPPMPSTFAPRRFAGQRATSPGNDAQASTTGMLSMPGQNQPRPSVQTNRPPAPQQQAPQAQTFAQMQTAGVARPNPVAPPSFDSAPPPVPPPVRRSGQLDTAGIGPPIVTTAANWQNTEPGLARQRAIIAAHISAGQEDQRNGYNVWETQDQLNARRGLTRNPANGSYDDPNTRSPYDVEGPWSFRQATAGDSIDNSSAPAPTPQGPATPVAGYNGGPSAPNGWNGGNQLQDAVSQSLSQQSRYGLPEVQQVRDALTAQLQQQFGGQQQQLDEDMARRGLGSSSIGSQYQTNLRGQQANALGSMNAQLTSDAANANAADRTAALGAGQNYYSSQQQSGQFGQSLAQQLRLALMGDRTQNRGIDAQSALANNALWAQLAQILGLSGVGSLTKSTTGDDTGNSGGDGGGNGAPAGRPPRVAKR